MCLRFIEKLCCGVDLGDLSNNTDSITPVAKKPISNTFNPTLRPIKEAEEKSRNQVSYFPSRSPSLIEEAALPGQVPPPSP